MRRVVLVLAIGCLATEAAAGRVEDRIARDELAVVEAADPVMAAAIRKGRETLPDFLKHARAPARSMSHFAVKVPVRAGDHDEFFWVTNFKSENGRYSGRIDNTPRWATHLKEGDTISFMEGEIVDWLYVDKGRMKGNFTFCALMQREDRAEAIAMIRSCGRIANDSGNGHVEAVQGYGSASEVPCCSKQETTNEKGMGSLDYNCVPGRNDSSQRSGPNGKASAQRQCR